MLTQATSTTARARSTLYGGGLKVGSAILVIIGIIWLAAAFGMNTSVYSDGFSVNNIGLQDDRRNQIFLGGLITLIGAIGFIVSTINPLIGGQRRQSAGARPANVELSSPAYKTWLIEEYNIEVHPVLGTYICGDQEFSDVESALRHAKIIDAVAIKQAAADEKNYSKRVKRNRKYAVVLCLLTLTGATGYFLMSRLNEERAIQAEKQRELDVANEREKAWEDFLKGTGG